MDILIKNCNLISMAYGRPKYEEHMSIYIENGRITEIGEDVIPKRGAQIIDASRKNMYARAHKYTCTSKHEYFQRDIRWLYTSKMVK